MALRRICLVLAPCWALAGAVLGVVVFRAWRQPPPPSPPFNPLTDGPLPATNPGFGFDVLFQAFYMAVPLGCVLLVAAAIGMAYLRSAMLARRRIAWACAVSAAAAVEVTFIAIFIDPVPLFGQMVYGRANWGLLGFSAAFVAAGAAMTMVITAAARDARMRGGSIADS